MNNFIVIVIDGVGVGELPDAHKYNDEGSNTLGNLAEAVGGLELPNLEKLGLGNITHIKGVKKVNSPLASFGKMTEVSNGKDSTTGHWELGGIKVEFDFPYYPDGFPDDLVNQFISVNKLEGILGNKPASGTEIIKELGAEHARTGYPIIYTSADSVFQIAANEDVIPLNRLYEICKQTREKILVGKNSVGRVIARPFIGSNGNFTRTVNRKDFSMDPVSETVLDSLYYNKIQTVGIGKINDLFNYRGIKVQKHTKSNSEGIEQILSYSEKETNSFIIANLVDFDVYYGHRNDPEGFYVCLKEFDSCIPQILNNLDNTDVLIITSDHGNDPTTVSTDHSREYVPLLYYRKNFPGTDLGVRETFSDVAKTAAHHFSIDNNLQGKSFLTSL